MGFWKYYYFILIVIGGYTFFIHISLNQAIVSGVVIVVGFIMIYLLKKIQKMEEHPID